MFKQKFKDLLIPKQEWILTDDHPKLHQKSALVDELTDNDWEIINKMICYIDACYNNEHKKYKIRPGIAIAAPQMGLNKQVIYVHFNENDVEYRYLLVNPKIISFSNMYSFVEDGEGCLSVPKDVQCNIPRNYKIVVEAFDLLTGQVIRITAKDLLSVCLQHEIDHLHGILYIDRVNKENPSYIDKEWIKIN